MTNFINTYRVTEVNGVPVFIAVSEEQYERLNAGLADVGDIFRYTASGGESGTVIITEKRLGPLYKADRCQED